MEGEKRDKKLASDDKKGFLTFFTKIFKGIKNALQK